MPCIMFLYIIGSEIYIIIIIIIDSIFCFLFPINLRKKFNNTTL